jgi:hypothetical protein
MRTTVDIEDEVLSALKEVARQQGVTLGQVISSLARRSLNECAPVKVRNGVRLFDTKPSSTRSDMSIVNALRDDA